MGVGLELRCLGLKPSTSYSKGPKSVQPRARQGRREEVHVWAEP
jgi:hypothetical protein